MNYLKETISTVPRVNNDDQIIKYKNFYRYTFLLTFCLCPQQRSTMYLSSLTTQGSVLHLIIPAPHPWIAFRATFNCTTLTIYKQRAI